MSEVFIPPKEKTGEHNGHAEQEGQEGMVPLAEKEIQFHTRPLPEAQEPPLEPFPAQVLRGLLAGVLAGGLIGLLFGVLLFENILVLPGWEALYSMGPFTFHVFWTLMGVALGVIIIGIGAILIAPGPPEGRDETT